MALSSTANRKANWHELFAKQTEASFCLSQKNDDVVLRHTLPVFTGLGRYPIVNWDFVGAVSIF